MVNLPSVPLNITTSEAPKSSLTPGQVASPYQQMADALGKVSEGLEKASIPLAEEAGYRAVTRDAEGNVQVERWPIIGPAAAHYAKAMKFAALADGEGEARRTDIELRTKYHDNPEGYLQAANAFKETLQKKYTDAAGAEVGVAIARAVDGVTTQTYRGLLNEKERLDLNRSVTTIDSEIETTKNQMYAMARGGVTSGRDWDMASGKIKALYGELGSNPRLAYPQEKIKLELSRFDSELKVSGLAHHIVDEVYAKQGYEAAAKAAERIRTDPKLNLSPAQRDTSYSRVLAELNSRARDDERVQKGIAGGITDVAKKAMEGYTVPPEVMGQLRAQVSASGSPGMTAALEQTEAIVSTMKQWSTMNPAQLEAAVGTLGRTMREKGATDIGLALKAAGEKLLTNMRKEVGSDPLGWANRTGVMPVPPIAFGTNDAPGQMANRAIVSEMIAKHYGVEPTYLRPDEKSALQVVAAQGGDAMLGVARALVDGFGDRATKVMGEISNDAPSLAHVGALMQSGGNNSFAVDVADAVKLRSGGKDVFKPQWVEKPDAKMIAAHDAKTRAVFGNAFALAPDSGRASQRAAQDAFQTRAIRNGLDPALGQGRLLPGVSGKDPAEAAFERTLQESAGARFVGGAQYGGIGDYKPGYWTNYRVLIPGNVRADSFKDVIGRITDDDLKKMAISPVDAAGNAYSSAKFREGVPVAVRGGYRFALGDPNSEDPKYIRGADGKPFVLDFGQMEERLRARVPGAFLGSK